ncbi:SH3-like domain-containing protein [Actinomadura rudentiformis]|uniref:SH3-like domain-containing protein n=1 Tax=Actinomadura rudentiformis TaxID=359158 RepID=UPI001CEFA1CE|nr:SH3-like domain-containing protein [Actinomadura rudentiformis]
MPDPRAALPQAQDQPSSAAFTLGDRVRVRAVDPEHHTRVPRYVRGQLGEIVHSHGAAPLPDDRARGIEPPRVETVHVVRFAARDLWGVGDHTVAVDLWESYLEPC